MNIVCDDLVLPCMEVARLVPWAKCRPVIFFCGCSEVVILIGGAFIGFDWASLKQEALVVDVGGGLGSATLHLMKEYPHLRYVVQDRPKVIDDAVKVCSDST